MAELRYSPEIGNKGFDPLIATRVGEIEGLTVYFGDVPNLSSKSAITETPNTYTETVGCPLTGENVYILPERLYSGGYGDTDSTVSISEVDGDAEITIVNFDQSHLTHPDQVQTMEYNYLAGHVDKEGRTVLSNDIPDDVVSSPPANYEVNFEEPVSSLTFIHADSAGEEGTPNSHNVCIQITPIETPPETTTTTTTTTTTPPTTTTTTTTTTLPPETTTTTSPPETTTTTEAPPETTTTTEAPPETTTTTEAPPETTTTSTPPTDETTTTLFDAGDDFNVETPVVETEATVEAAPFIPPESSNNSDVGIVTIALLPVAFVGMKIFGAVRKSRSQRKSFAKA